MATPAKLPGGKYHCEGDAADVLGKSVTTLRNRRRRGYGPPYVTVGRSKFYREESLIDWLRKMEKAVAIIAMAILMASMLIGLSIA
jgi:hypothetical protein